MSTTQQNNQIDEAQLLDDHAVDLIAKAMKAKLLLKRQQGFGGWHDISKCSAEHLANSLIAAVAKGDPVDVANFAMMLFWRHENHDALKHAYGVTGETAMDSKRYQWLLPIFTSRDEQIANARALKIAVALTQGLDGNAVVDAAMKSDGQEFT